MQKRTKTILIVGGIIIVLLIAVAIINSYSYNYGYPGSASSARGIAMAPQAPAYDYGEEFGLDFMADSAMYEKAAGSPETPSVAQATDRLIIKTGSLSIVVKDVNEAINAISAFAKENGGFVVSSNIYKVENTPYGTVTIRIPSSIFDQGFAKMKEFGDVESENVNGQDVTEEYVDMEARLKNLRLTESRLQDILNQTGTITEVLEVERELKSIRAEIESMQARMKYLKESADLSAITVNLSTDPSVLPAVDEADKWRPLGVIKEAARSMVNALKGVANLIIWLVIYIPIWLIIGLLIYLGVRIFRRYWK